MGLPHGSPSHFRPAPRGTHPRAPTVTARQSGGTPFPMVKLNLR
jgi:hypothetical protein